MRSAPLLALVLFVSACAGGVDGSDRASKIVQVEADAGSVDLDARFDAAFFRHYLVGEQVVALAEFQRLADRGHLRSAEMLAVAYTHGEGVEPDPGEAARWLARAAALGSRRAARGLTASRARRS